MRIGNSIAAATLRHSKSPSCTPRHCANSSDHFALRQCRAAPAGAAGLESEDDAYPNMKRPPENSPGAVPFSSGDRIRTCDLWVMSPASYRAAPPRDG